MRRDRHHRYHVLARSLEPEDAVCAGGLVFGIGFEYVFALGAGQRAEFVGAQAWVAGMGLQVAHGLLHGLQPFLVRRVPCQLLEIGTGLIREVEMETESAVDEFAEITAALDLAVFPVLQALAHFFEGGGGLVFIKPCLASGNFLVGLEDKPAIFLRECGSCSRLSRRRQG
jgi:hypothetical protein